MTGHYGPLALSLLFLEAFLTLNSRITCFQRGPNFRVGHKHPYDPKASIPSKVPTIFVEELTGEMVLGTLRSDSVARKRLAASLAAGLAGMLVNLFTLDVFGGARMTFGGIFPLIAALHLGPWYGLLASLIAEDAKTPPSAAPRTSAQMLPGRKPWTKNASPHASVHPQPFWTSIWRSI